MEPITAETIKHIYQFLLIVVLIATTACSESKKPEQASSEIRVIGENVYVVEKPRKTLIYGKINEAFVTELRSAAKNGRTIQIMSQGGDVLAGQAAAMVIREFQPKIEIATFCFSACAEFILVEASRYQRIDNTANVLIGFHHNPLIARKAMSSKPELFEACFGKHLRAFESVRNLDSDFLDFQIKKIDLFWEMPFYVNQTKCSTVEINYKYDYWLPTSQVLNDELGIRFKKPLCADLGPKKCLLVIQNIPSMPKKNVAF
ncbi:MAG: hypothetical protein V3U57_06555 [Robiginitomaculum sp.]